MLFSFCFLFLKKAPLFLSHDSFFSLRTLYQISETKNAHNKKNQTCNSNWVATAIVFLFASSNPHSSRCQMLMYYTVIDKGDSSRRFFFFCNFIHKKKLKVVSIFFLLGQLFFHFFVNLQMIKKIKITTKI